MRRICRETPSGRLTGPLVMVRVKGSLSDVLSICFSGLEKVSDSMAEDQELSEQSTEWQRSRKG